MVNKIMLVLFCVAIFLLIGAYINGKIEKRDMLLLHFAGIAEKVSYADAKGSPEFFIKEKKYFLSSLYWHVYLKIKSGDAVIKKSGNMQIKVFKNSNGKVIIID